MPADEDDDFRPEYLSREQDIAVARSEARRDLRETESRIAYVAFVPGHEDFCLCEFHLEPPHGWVQSFRTLRPDERRADEQITDEHIRAVAASGNLIAAIRLYRTRYDVGLADGKAGVERLLGRPL